MMPSLVLIDGMPGTGKSTLAANISLAMGTGGRDVQTLYETDPNHPLHPVPVDELGAAWADIHERVSPGDYASKSLDNWAKFLVRADHLRVVESYPFQSAVRVLLQMESPRSLIAEYWKTWQQIVLPHHPHLVYLQVIDPVRAINDIAGHRGDVWTQYIANAFQQMPFSTARGLSGWAAVENFLSTYTALMNELVATCAVPITILPGHPKDYAERDVAVLDSLRSS